MKRLAAPMVAVLLFVIQPLAALAHPLGNFTVNRYSRVEVSGNGVRVRYVLDLAEIPTFQAMASLDANGDGTVTDTEKASYGSRTLAQVTRNLHLSLSGSDVPLRAASTEVELLPGQAGLQTLRVAAWLDGPTAGHALEQAGRATSPGQRALRLDYGDDNEPERIGWREIVVEATGVSVAPAAGGAVPVKDVSAELRTYPEGMLTSPLDVRQVHLDVSPGTAGTAGSPGGTTAAAPEAAPGPGVPRSPSLSRASDGFAELFTSAASKTLTPLVFLLALAGAFLFGGVHAMSPGHGKTIVGAYLVGARGTARHALFLGLTVTAVHTAGVFALLLGTLIASRYVLPERIYPWMSLLSGALVLGMGLTLIRARWHAAQSPGSATESREVHTRVDGDHGDHGDLGHYGGTAHTHASDHVRTHAAARTHTHTHGLGAHTHVIPGADGSPVTWRSLLALGISGGLLPCPSALVVGLGAIALHQVGFGLILIAAFSSGLAATLMTIGLLMVYSGRAAGHLRLAERLGLGAGSRGAKAIRAVPVLSAGIVALAGLALTFEAAGQLVDVTPLLAWWYRSESLPMLAVLLGVAAVALGLHRAKAPPAHATTGGGEAAVGHGHDPDHGHGHHHDEHQHDGAAHPRHHVHATLHTHQHHDHDHDHNVRAQDHGLDDDGEVGEHVHESVPVLAPR